MADEVKATSKADKANGRTAAEKSNVAYNAIERYIPAPIVGTFIGIDAYIPRGGITPEVPNFDQWLILAVSVCLGVIAFTFLRWARVYPGFWTQLSIALSVPAWCLLVSSDRFEEFNWWYPLSILFGVYIALLLLVLTLRNPGAAE